MGFQLPPTHDPHFSSFFSILLTLPIFVRRYSFCSSFRTDSPIEGPACSIHLMTWVSLFCNLQRYNILGYIDFQAYLRNIRLPSLSKASVIDVDSNVNHDNVTIAATNPKGEKKMVSCKDLSPTVPLTQNTDSTIIEDTYQG
jgi:hypothetical protein